MGDTPPDFSNIIFAYLCQGSLMYACLLILIFHLQEDSSRGVTVMEVVDKIGQQIAMNSQGNPVHRRTASLGMYSGQLYYLKTIT